MYVRTYVRMYVCMYVYMYVYIYVCKYVCMYVCVYVCMYVCVSMSVHCYVHNALSVVAFFFLAKWLQTAMLLVPTCAIFAKHIKLCCGIDHSPDQLCTELL